MTGKSVVAALLILAALGLTVLWPGDASWNSDEPRLLAAAWHANHDFELARGGLWGNFGIRYGPVPTWIYQALLLFTHEPITLLAIRALLCAGASAAGLLWLARELRLPAWFAGAILAAPYVVFYHRLMWDASFAMPLSILTLAAFASFVRSESRWSLGVTIAGAILLCTIHPQSLPLALAVLGWLVWRRRPALRNHWKMLAVILFVFLASHGPWIVEAVFGFLHNLSGSVARGYPNGARHLTCALAPLLGGTLIGSPHSSSLVVARPSWADWLLGVSYLLAWCGIVCAARRWRAPETPRDIVAVVVLLGLVLQALLFGAMRIPAQPQYFFGTFALHAFLMWLAVDELRWLKLGRILGVTFAANALLLSYLLAETIHQYGYYAPLGWPTLKNQVAVARELNVFTDTTARTNVPLFQKYPQSLRALRLLLPPPPGEPHRTNERLAIVPVPDRDSHEVMLERDSREPGEVIDITPLPKGWQPETW